MAKYRDDWRSRSRRLYPLAAHAVRTRPASGLWLDGNPIAWEFVYFRAIARNSRAAWILGLGIPTICLCISLAARFVFFDDIEPWVIVIMLVTGIGMLLPWSLGASYLLRRPYWQPGVVSLLFLGYLVGIPLMVVAQVFYGGLPRQSVQASILDWATVQGMFIALGPSASAAVWLPVAWRMYYKKKKRGIS